MIIESAKNSLFKQLLSLTESRGIKKHRQFLLHGKKIVEEQLARRPQAFISVIYQDDHQPISTPQADHLRPLQLPKELFQQLDVIGSRSPILVGTLPDLPNWSAALTPKDGIDVLTPVGDPKNLGALARSFAAFGGSHFVCLEEAANPFLPQAIKASSGAILDIKVCKGPSIQKLNPHDVEMIALDGQGESLTKLQWPNFARLLIGEEGPGLPATANLQTIRIDMEAHVESLNATVAGSIALYDWHNKTNS